MHCRDDQTTDHKIDNKENKLDNNLELKRKNSKIWN